MLFSVASVLALAALGMSGVQAGMEEKIEKRMALRTHSIAPPYVDTDLQNRWWDFGGDAIINTNKHIRLTQDRQSEKGWLWSRMPLSVQNWQMDFEFKVDGKSNSFYGDGFAVWVTRDRAAAGPVFGNQDYFTGLGIFFDTYANSRHSYTFPRVTAMMGDGKKKYDLDHDNAEHELAACSENFRRRDVATKGRLTFIKGHGLELQLHLEKWDKWTTCFTIPSIQLPENPFIGFTAATGDAHDNHDIISVQTYTVTLHPQYRASNDQQAAMAAPGVGQATAQGRAPKSSSSGGVVSWFLFLLKMIGILAFVAFAVAAYRTYAAQQRARPTYY